jgi:hypothetical protein
LGKVEGDLRWDADELEFVIRRFPRQSFRHGLHQLRVGVHDRENVLVRSNDHVRAKGELTFPLHGFALFGVRQIFGEGDEDLTLREKIDEGLDVALETTARRAQNFGQIDAARALVVMVMVMVMVMTVVALGVGVRFSVFGFGRVVHRGVANTTLRRTHLSRRAGRDYLVQSQ